MEGYYNLSSDELQAMLNAAAEKAISEFSGEKKNIFLTRVATAKRLGVDVSTLWRWAQMGYIKPIHRGGRVWFAESDIAKIEKGEMKA